MGSTLAALTSVLPATVLPLGLLAILTGSSESLSQLVQTGWGLVTVGIVVEFVLPISRRLR